MNYKDPNVLLSLYETMTIYKSPKALLLLYEIMIIYKSPKALLSLYKTVTSIRARRCCNDTNGATDQYATDFYL